MQIPQKVDIPHKVVIMQGIVENDGLGIYAKYGLRNLLKMMVLPFELSKGIGVLCPQIQST